MHKLKNYFFGATLCGAMMMDMAVMAQTAPAPQPDPPKNWHELDLATDGYFGVMLSGTMHPCRIHVANRS